MNQANQLANDPKAVQGVIDNIIRLNTLAFAPIVGQANAAGIYNSSTLGLLAGEASAASSAQTAAAALNFKQGEQQIAAGIGSNLLGAEKTSTTTGTTGTTQNTTQNTNNLTTQQTAPISGSILNTILGIGGLFAANKLFSAGTSGNSPLDLLINKIFPSGDPGALPADLIPSPNDISGSIINPAGNIGGVAIGGNTPFR